MQENKYIYQLISREILFGLNDSEKEELQVWLNESDDNVVLYEKLVSESNVNAYHYKRSQINVKANWKVVEKAITPSRRIKISPLVSYAAAVLIVFSFASVYYLLTKRIDKHQQVLAHQVIKPGSESALLILADGDKIDLSNKAQNKQVKFAGGIVNRDSAVVKYSTVDTSKVEKFNTIVVPKGGEYNLQLCDGTTVYLNSQTSLKFPVAFVGKRRVVYIEGEAYFKVAKNKKLPFIVKSKHMDVQVTGTEFNVKAYSDDKQIETTLIEGGVNILSGKDKKEKAVLKPSEQARYNSDNHDLVVEEVDVDFYTAWRNGQFVFKENRLEDIMKVLGRWYDFNVFYQNKSTRDIKFSGKIDRYESIYSIIDVIKCTQKLDVEVKGKTIVFIEKSR